MTLLLCQWLHYVNLLTVFGPSHRQLLFLNGHSGLEKDMFGTPTVEVNCTGVESTNLGPKGANLNVNIMVLRMRTCLIMIHCPMGMTHYTDLMTLLR